MASPETSSIGARLQARLGQVEVMVRELGLELEAALVALKERGKLPALHQLVPARDAVSALWSEAATVARELGLDPSVSDEGPCLADLSQAIAMIETRQREQTHRESRKVLALEKVARLDHFRARTDQARGVLLELQTRGRELCQRLHSQEDPTTVEEVLSGREALVAFIELVEELQRSMEGERLDELEERVQNTLGRPASRAAHHVEPVEAVSTPVQARDSLHEVLPPRGELPNSSASGGQLETAGEERESPAQPEEAAPAAAEPPRKEAPPFNGAAGPLATCVEELPEDLARSHDGQDHAARTGTAEGTRGSAEVLRPGFRPLATRPTPRPIRRRLPEPQPIIGAIPILVREPDAPPVPTRREDLDRCVLQHVAAGELVQAAAFAQVLKERHGADAGPDPAVLLALMGYVSALPTSAREDWETWALHEVDTRSFPFALIWGVSAVLWHGAAVTQLDSVKERVRASFGAVDPAGELLACLLDLGARGMAPGQQVLASRSAHRSGQTADDLRGRLDNAFARAASAPYQNKDCKRAWKALTQERIDPVRRAVANRAIPAELRRLASSLDVVNDLRRLEIEGNYRNGMLTRFREIQDLVAQLAEAQEASREASSVERLSDLVTGACGHARWGALLRRVLEPRTLRREAPVQPGEVPLEALDTIDGLMRRRALYPVFCEEGLEALELKLVAAGLMGEPLEVTDQAELFRAYLDLEEYGAARRVLDQLPGSVAGRHELDELLSHARFATESRAEELLRQCGEVWAEAASAGLVGPQDELGGSPFDRAEGWFRDHPSRLRPLVHWLEELLAALTSRIEEERLELERRLKEALERARTVVSREEGRELLRVREEAARLALQERNWSIAQQDIDELETVSGDSAALRLPGRGATAGLSWQRAIPSRPPRTELASVKLPAEAPDQGEEGAKFLGTWNELSTTREKPGLTWKAVGSQWTKWMGFEPGSDQAPTTDDGVVFEFSLRSGVAWVSDRFGARGTRYQLLVPKARRGQPTAIRRAVQQLTAQTQDDVLRVVLYPGVLPEHMLPSTSASDRVAVIDDQDILRLLECPADERPRGFLEAVLPQLPIDLAAPFRVNGATPESMFVGRTNELELLMGRDAPTVIFSGRCLGKTSLLRQAERRFHDPSRGRFAFFRSISTLGDLEVSSGHLPNLGLLEELVGALRGAGFRIEPVASLTDFTRSMRALLDEHPKHELLFLLDEADGFADSERRFGGKGVSWALRDLQFESDDRLRFTFAGYQHVHRVCRERSLAFANWRGLRKLSVLSEEDALRLVRQPMEEIGFTFATQGLAGRVVHYTGHHPRLLQVFCDRLSRHVRKGARTEPFRVTSSDVERVFNDTSANGFVEALRYTLNLNLQEDGRLQFIVYWLVEEAMRGALSLDRFSLHEIHDALVKEGGDAPQLDETGTRLLLDELEALGVVDTEGGHYRLANRQHARLLFQAPDFRAVRDRAAHRLKERPVRRRIYCASDEVTEVVAQAHDSHVCVLGTPCSGDEVLFDILFASRAKETLRIECESADDWGELQKRLAARCELGEGTGLAEGLLAWQAGRGVPACLVLEDVDALARSHPEQLREFLERLATARLDGGDLCVRLILSGGVDLARLFNEELLLYSTTKVTLTRLETGDVESWCRARRLVVAADLRARLHQVAGGRLAILEDFRGFLHSRGASPSDELPVSRADVDEYASALREGKRVSLGKQLLGGLTGPERRTLEYLCLQWGGDLPGDQVAEFAQFLADEFPEVAEKDVSTILESLASLDLLGGSRTGGGGYAQIPGDPLRLLLGPGA